MITAFLARAWARAWPYIAGLAGIIVGLFFVRQSGKDAARAEDAARINKQAEQARREHRDVAQKVDAMGDPAVSDRLKSGWVRDTTRRD